MPLAAELETTFSSGEFALGAVLTSLSGVLGDVGAPVPALDADAITGAAGRLGEGDFGGISQVLQGVLEAATGAGANLPVLGDLLGPLEAAIATVELLTSPDA